MDMIRRENVSQFNLQGPPSDITSRSIDFYNTKNLIFHNCSKSNTLITNFINDSINLTFTEAPNVR